MPPLITSRRITSRPPARAVLLVIPRPPRFRLLRSSPVPPGLYYGAGGCQAAIALTGAFRRCAQSYGQRDRREKRGGGKRGMAASQETIDADFVIVGAGSAGCVMAARLSEDPAHTGRVAGSRRHDNHFWIHVPLGYGKTITDPASTGVTRPSRTCNGRRFSGRVARCWADHLDQRPGLYPRPARGFRPLAAAGQCRLVVRRRAAIFPARRGQAGGGNEFHGTGGPLAVSDIQAYDPISKAFIKSAIDSAFRATTTSTARRRRVSGYYQLTTRNGRRCSTAVGYLRPVMKRPQPAGDHRRADRERDPGRPPRGRRDVTARTAREPRVRRAR